MNKRKLSYKTPTIIRNKSGDWYIQYYFENPNQPGKFEPFKVRSGINRIKDPSKKEREAQVLRKDVENWLGEGNSPYTQESEVLHQIIAKQTEIAQIKELAKKKNWTIIDAIGHYCKFIKGNGYSPRTLETYKGYLDDIEEAFADSPLAALYAKDLTEYDVAPLIETCFRKTNGRRGLTITTSALPARCSTNVINWSALLIEPLNIFLTAQISILKLQNHKKTKPTPLWVCNCLKNC